MTTVRYSLDDFIQEMTALVAAEPDQARRFDRGAPLIERLVRSPEAIPTQFRSLGPASTRNATSYILHRGPGLSVSAVVWGPGAHAAPHDHHTWGMIGVIGNGIQETRYRRVDDRARPDYAELVQDRINVVRAGEVSLLIPDVDEIHAMDNTTDQPTIEVHVYGTDLVGLDRCRFNLETGTVQHWTTRGYANC